MPGLGVEPFLAPALRSLSAPVTATPVTHDDVALALELVDDELGECSPNLIWSVLTVRPHFVVTVLSNDTTTILRSQACWTTPLRPLVGRGVDDDAVDALGDQVGDLLVWVATSLPAL
jgi:hypothetical protein